MDVDVGGNEEVVVEDMVPGVDSEEMTPVPGEGEEEVPEAEEEYPEQGDEEEEEVVVAEEEEAVEEEDDGDDKFAPGTLGKLADLVAERVIPTDGLVWAKCTKLSIKPIVEPS